MEARAVYYFKTDQEWTSTPLEEIQVDVHLNGNTVSLPLTMLVEIIYPLIEKRMNAALLIELRDTTPPPRVISIEISPEAIAKAFS